MEVETREPSPSLNVLFQKETEQGRLARAGLAEYGDVLCASIVGDTDWNFRGLFVIYPEAHIQIAASSHSSVSRDPVIRKAGRERFEQANHDEGLSCDIQSGVPYASKQGCVEA